MTTDAQLGIDLADLSDTVADQNVTLNSLSGELSTLNRFVSILNDTVEEMTLSGNKKSAIVNNKVIFNALGLYVRKQRKYSM